MKIKYTNIFILVIFIFSAVGCQKEDREQYTLTTTTSPSEGGVISLNDNQFNEFNEGEEVQLVATPSDGYYFKNWSGAIEGDKNPRTVTINANKEIIAVFNLLDSDNDGVADITDECDRTPSGEPVNELGCSSSQIDSDEDGVSNALDNCLNTLAGELVDELGCADSQKDSDNDGINNDIDACPGTLVGKKVNEIGCEIPQTDAGANTDTDADGVSDDMDQCPETPADELVDSSGCSLTQIDSDEDGVNDSIDQCADTLDDENVNEKGCSIAQTDSDDDGVYDDKDKCKDTPSEETVDYLGCSDSQNDNDGDGIYNDQDTCPNTPKGDKVDSEGCSDSQKDSDEDGVTDDLDQCLNSPNEVIVDANGCTVIQQTYVPDDNFEQYLIDEGYDDFMDDYVVTANIKNVNEVSIGGSGLYSVSDLTGLEDFIALSSLYLERAELIFFDMQKYKSLKELTFWNSSLEGNLVIDNTNLEILRLDLSGPDTVIINDNKLLNNISVADYAKFKTLEISNNPLIESLQTLENLIIENLVISNNESLKYFFCVYCGVENASFSNNKNLFSISFDVTGANLKYFELINNVRLTSLNLSSVELISLNVKNNKIEFLDVSQNLGLLNLNSSGNPLTCIKG